MARGRVTLGPAAPEASPPLSHPAASGKFQARSLSELVAGAAGRGAVALLFLLPLAASAFAMLRAGTGAEAPAAALRALGSSLWVSAASAALAVLMGLPGAWLLARVEYRGKALHAGLQAIPLAFPPVLFLLGFVSAWGNEGLVGSALSAAGIPYDSSYLYSLAGVVFAQACYNAPLASLVVAKSWEGIGRGTLEAARSLGAAGPLTFGRVVLPALRGGLLAAFAMIFLFCFMSFVIPLSLGGGPRGETLEVSIYSAVRNSLDFGRAGLVAIVETAVAMLVLALYLAGSGSSRDARGFAEKKPRLSSFPPRARVLAVLYIAVFALLTALPVVALGASSFLEETTRSADARLGLGAWAATFSDPGFWSSLGGSVAVGLPAAAIAVAASLLIVYGSRRGGKGSAIAMAPLAVSSTVLSLGYLVLFPAGGNPLLYAAIAAAGSAPLAYRLIHEARSGVGADLSLAARSLGASRTRAFILVEAALLLPAIRSAFALATSASLGDLNSLLVLPSGDFSTLALRTWRQMGAYRFDAAATGGVVLAAIAFAAFALASRVAGGRKA